MRKNTLMDDDTLTRVIHSCGIRREDLTAAARDLDAEEKDCAEKRLPPFLNADYIADEAIRLGETR